MESVLLFTQKGYRSPDWGVPNGNDYYSGSQEYYNTAYVEFQPLNIVFNPFSSFPALCLTTGLYAGLGGSGREIHYDIYSDMVPFDFGPVVGIGIKHGQLQLGVHYEYGLINLPWSNYDFIFGGSDHKAFNRLVMASAGQHWISTPNKAR